jgi:hypothetical protein
VNVPSLADYSLCNFTPPDNSQFTVDYDIVIVGTAALTSRANYKISASGRRSGGTVTVQSGATLLADNAIPGDPITVTVDALGSAVYLKVAIGATAEEFNMFATGKLRAVTTGT